MARTKRPVRARKLTSAYAGSSGRDGGPLMMRLLWEQAEGVAAVAGREVTATLGWAELYKIAGALPMIALDGADDDTLRAYKRVLDFLASKAGEQS